MEKNPPMHLGEFSPLLIRCASIQRKIHWTSALLCESIRIYRSNYLDFSSQTEHNCVQLAKLVTKSPIAEDPPIPSGFRIGLTPLISSFSFCTISDR